MPATATPTLLALAVATTVNTTDILLREDRTPFLPHTAAGDDVLNTGAPCVQADFGAPLGQFDIGDVIAFLQLFGQGCP